MKKKIQLLFILCICVPWCICGGERTTSEAGSLVWLSKPWASHLGCQGWVLEVVPKVKYPGVTEQAICSWCFENLYIDICVARQVYQQGIRKNSLLTTFLSTFFIICFLNDCLSDWRKMHSQCWFVFLRWLVKLNIFLCSLATCSSSFRELSVHLLIGLFETGFPFFVCENVCCTCLCGYIGTSVFHWTCSPAWLDWLG